MSAPTDVTSQKAEREELAGRYVRVTQAMAKAVMRLAAREMKMSPEDSLLALGLSTDDAELVAEFASRAQPGEGWRVR